MHRVPHLVVVRVQQARASGPHGGRGALRQRRRNGLPGSQRALLVGCAAAGAAGLEQPAQVVRRQQVLFGVPVSADWKMTLTIISIFVYTKDSYLRHGLGRWFRLVHKCRLSNDKPQTRCVLEC